MIARIILAPTTITTTMTMTAEGGEVEAEDEAAWAVGAAGEAETAALLAEAATAVQG